MANSNLRRDMIKFVTQRVPIDVSLLDEWSHWVSSKVGRSDLASLSLITGLILWFRAADISYDNFYQFMTTSFELNSNSISTNSTNSTSIPSKTNRIEISNTSLFFESLMKHFPNYIASAIIKHSTATVSIVYFILFISFLLFSSPIYQLRYIRNKSFSGYSFLVYIIYCWLFISMLSHLPIIHQLVEEPLALFPYFYGLTVITVSSINIVFRIILNRIFVFHIGTRRRTFEVLQSSAFISLACSMLYANCGNTNSTNLNLDFEDGTYIFCKTLFESVASSSNTNYENIPPVLTMWLTGVTIMCVNYIIEGTVNDRFIFFRTEDLKEITEYVETEVITVIDSEQAKLIPMKRKDRDIYGSPSTSLSQESSVSMEAMSSSDDCHDNHLIQNGFHSSPQISPKKLQFDKNDDNSGKIEDVITPNKNTIIRRIVHSAEPRDVHEMVSWFAMSTGWILLDLVIALGIFLDRYDRRELNDSLTALQSIIDNENRINREKNKSSKIRYNQSFNSISSSIKQKRKRKRDYTSSCSSSISSSIHLPTSSPSPIPREVIIYDVTNLSNHQQCNSSCFSYLKNKNELWFDFMADCGDGFHPSYEIARLLAQPYLIGTNNIKLPRANLLLIGGDLAYPGPTTDNYQRKLFRVFQDALRPPENIIKNLKENKPQEISYRKPQLPDGQTLESYQGPTCLMIPGNHDWYDGLQTFCRFICNRNWFGGWFMPQTSSYFVNALPHNWWIFAVDYALNGDMDTKQFQYFAKIVESYFDDDVRAERVIIMTHQPDWIINDHEGSNLGENLRYLINNIIGHDRLRLRLAGDIHNYTRHETRSAVQSGFKYNMMEKRKKRSVSTESNKPSKNGNKLHFQDIPLQSSTRNLKRNMKRSRSLDNINFLSDKSYNDPTLIVSGGGGAFLHPTHVPEKKPIFYNDAIYERVCEYPSVLKSRAYAFFNIFGFRKRNLSFDLLGGIAYYLMVSSLFPLCNLQINSHLEEIKWSTLLSKYCQIFVQVTFEVFERSYISITVLIMAIIGMYVWTEAHLSIRTRCTITIVHVVTHYVASMTVIILMEMIIEAALENELIGKKSAFDTFQTHFKLTQDVLQHIDNHYTFGVITYILKMLFTVVDITGFHVSLRKSMCSSKYKQIELILQQFKDYPAETLFSLSKVNGELYNIVPSRFSRFLYHTTAFLFYFIFAAPVVSFVIGIYLFVSAKFGKYNEAFSSLRLDTFKNFVRFHLKYDGSLHCYVIGVDKVPHRWRQDPKWDGRGQLASIDIDNTDNNNNNDSIKRETVCDKIISSPNKQYNQESSQRTMIRDMRYLGPSYTWNYPSRWIPYNSSGDTNMSSKHEYRRVQIIDQFVLH